MIKAKLKDIINEITDKSTSNTEYLGYFNNKQYYFKPTELAKTLFKDRIGDKWSNSPAFTSSSKMIKIDLLHTNMVLSGYYLLARGGLCPSGVRLAEITDIKNLEQYTEEEKL